MHFAPETRWATHSSRGRRPFDSSPNSLTPSAHWTGSPTTFFLSRIAVRKPVEASCRAAIPPEGPAPTMTASNTSDRESGADISALRRGLSGESSREVLSVGGRTVYVGRDPAAKSRSPLFRDELDRGQDAEAVDRRVLGKAHLLDDLVRARVGMIPKEMEDR